MSLFSYMNLATGRNGAAVSGSSVYTSVLEQLTTAKAKLDAGATKSSSAVTISSNATIAAAVKNDAGKTAAALVADIRSALDKQYSERRTRAADLSAMSPRAVATIALNPAGAFSKLEVAGAKAEMKARDRTEFLSATANDFSLEALTAYQDQRLAARATMSAEERMLRDGTG